MLEPIPAGGHFIKDSRTDVSPSYYHLPKVDNYTYLSYN